MLQGSKLGKLGSHALAAQRLNNNCSCKMEKFSACVWVIFRLGIGLVDVFRHTVKRTLDDHYSTYFFPELMAK